MAVDKNKLINLYWHNFFNMNNDLYDNLKNYCSIKRINTIYVFDTNNFYDPNSSGYQKASKEFTELITPFIPDIIKKAGLKNNQFDRKVLIKTLDAELNDHLAARQTNLPKNIDLTVADFVNNNLDVQLKLEHYFAEDKEMTASKKQSLIKAIDQSKAELEQIITELNKY